MLIRNAEIWRRGIADVRITDGFISEIGSLTPHMNEQIIDAQGGALLPGLHDHHIHLAATAVARASIQCGPPHITNEYELAKALQLSGTGWLRGISYHESVAGMLDAPQIDAIKPDRPIRIQHRSGRMWFFNSLGISEIIKHSAPPNGLEQLDGRWTGRLFDEDEWLRDTLKSTPPGFAEISAELTSYGVTGITDMSPANDPKMAAHFANEQASDHLLQRVVLSGQQSLTEAIFDTKLMLGPVKFHLHENDLPNLNTVILRLQTAHSTGRPSATHCTTLTELVFILAALRISGTIKGDRIEHGGIIPYDLLTEMSDMGLHVISQPHFISERGDQYLRDVDKRDLPDLYRLATLDLAGIILAGGSDSPYGKCDPWAAMRAAVSRQSASGIVIGPQEALTPERALLLYLNDPHDLSRERCIDIGAPADLCLLNRPWAQARNRLLVTDVCATIIDGSIVYDLIDQTPI